MPKVTVNTSANEAYADLIAISAFLLNAQDNFVMSSNDIALTHGVQQIVSLSHGGLTYVRSEFIPTAKAAETSNPGFASTLLFNDNSGEILHAVYWASSNDLYEKARP